MRCKLIPLVLTQSETTKDGKESTTTLKSEAPTLKWGNGKSSLLEKTDMKSSMAIPQSASVETTSPAVETAHATASKTQDDPNSIVVCVFVSLYSYSTGSR